MRDYKFRGIRKDNGRFVVGSLFQSKEYNEAWILEENDLSDDNFSGGYSFPKDLIHSVEIIPETIGQYVEILNAYEGDILKGSEQDEYGSTLSSWTGIVKYNEDKCRIMIQDDLEDWFEVDDFEFDDVIGNIYQHKELIRKE